jgi:hypothetical protein
VHGGVFGLLITGNFGQPPEPERDPQPGAIEDLPEEEEEEDPDLGALQEFDIVD